MAGITAKHREEVITDIAPYRAERDRILASLARIYAEFEEGKVDALASREKEIVDLVNRFNELTHVIDRFDAAAERRANILAGWEILKQHREDEP